MLVLPEKVKFAPAVKSSRSNDSDQGSDDLRARSSGGPRTVTRAYACSTCGKHGHNKNNCEEPKLKQNSKSSKKPSSATRMAATPRAKERKEKRFTARVPRGRHVGGKRPGKSLGIFSNEEDAARAVASHDETWMLDTYWHPAHGHSVSDVEVDDGDADGDGDGDDDSEPGSVDQCCASCAATSKNAREDDWKYAVGAAEIQISAGAPARRQRMLMCHACYQNWRGGGAQCAECGYVHNLRTTATFAETAGGAAASCAACKADVTYWRADVEQRGLARFEALKHAQQHKQKKAKKKKSKSGVRLAKRTAARSRIAAKDKMATSELKETRRKGTGLFASCRIFKNQCTALSIDMYISHQLLFLERQDRVSRPFRVLRPLAGLITLLAGCHIYADVRNSILACRDSHRHWNVPRHRPDHG